MNRFTIAILALGAVLLFVFGCDPGSPAAAPAPQPGAGGSAAGDAATWAEAKDNAQRISTALKVCRAEGSGTLSTYGGNNGPIYWIDLMLEEAEFNTAHFNCNDYRLENLDKAAGTWTVAVGPSSKSGGPKAVYRLSSDGTVSGNAP
ncbi:MAG: hypothetical protein AB7K09_14430 [Planctomycetota bacterium]